LFIFSVRLRSTWLFRAMFNCSISGPTWPWRSGETGWGMADSAMVFIDVVVCLEGNGCADVHKDRCAQVEHSFLAGFGLLEITVYHEEGKAAADGEQEAVGQGNFQFRSEAEAEESGVELVVGGYRGFVGVSGHTPAGRRQIDSWNRVGIGSRGLSVTIDRRI